MSFNKFYEFQNLSNLSQNWSLSGGYVDEKVKYPFRFFKTNRIAFHMAFDNEDKPNICFKYGGTYRVMFHLPNEPPMWDFSVKSIIEMGFLRALDIEAKLKTTHESLRFYTPEQRKCYFEGKFVG